MLIKIAGVCFLLYIFAVRGESLCKLAPVCGTECDRTCDNTCKCDDAGVTYGGQCLSADFCQNDFLHLEDCIEEGGSSCPTRMLGIEELLRSFTTFDYRIDVRSTGEWDEGHANISIHTPGLSKNNASGYLDQIGGLEDKNILVYCRSGGRAFAASQNLLRYGFRHISSFYHGGFPNLERAIKAASPCDPANHPTKNLCYITGGSDTCPTPLPWSHVGSIGDIKDLGGNVVLVDVRPVDLKQFKEGLPNAHRVAWNKPDEILRFLGTLEDDDTILVFCKEGMLSFLAAKEIRKEWKGALYWLDNGGYQQLKTIQGIENL